VVLGEQEISELPERERARVRREEIGFLFQSDDLLPFLTAAENVALQLALHGEQGGGERGLQLLASLGLADHADKLPDQLSGGQRQRVGMARALVHRPGVILADEPTGELDTVTATRVLTLLRELAGAGAAVLIVTHSPEVAATADREIRLLDGRVEQ
jgi:lipoprotein-releasing system ATP-binding protein